MYTHTHTHVHAHTHTHMHVNTQPAESYSDMSGDTLLRISEPIFIDIINQQQQTSKQSMSEMLLIWLVIPVICQFVQIASYQPIWLLTCHIIMLPCICVVQILHWCMYCTMYMHNCIYKYFVITFSFSSTWNNNMHLMTRLRLNFFLESVVMVMIERHLIMNSVRLTHLTA